MTTVVRPSGPSREEFAERLLKGSVKKSYAPVVDIDWDAPVDPDKFFLPPQMCTLYGTDLWEAMTREQQIEMSRQELVNVLSAGVWFENILNQALLRDMMHKNRVWSLGPVPTPEDLARKLTGSSWTLCTGFFVAGREDYVFLNDATHEDGAAEFACCKKLGPDRFLQVESITFSWMDAKMALAYIQQTLAGEYYQSDFATPLTLNVEPLDKHGRCHLCM